MKIAFLVESSKKQVYEEISQILKINMEPYHPNKQYDILIIDGKTDDVLHDISSVTGILFDGSSLDTSIKSQFAQVIDFNYSLGKEAHHMLTYGQPAKQAAYPKLDSMLDSLKKTLVQHTLLVEIPPSPWGYPYSVALTHDVDAISLTELPVGKTLLGFFYRCFFKNLVRFFKKNITFRKYLKGTIDALAFPFAKLGIVKDCWAKSISEICTYEEKYNIRSSFYFISIKGVPGHAPDGKKAPSNRAAYYNLVQNLPLLTLLSRKGWEIGVHGLDGYRDAIEARKELDIVKSLVRADSFGHRTHWLYLENTNSWMIFDRVGYSYDSTFGYNSHVGFRAGTLQAYRPPGCNNIIELPLHIQDNTLLGEEYEEMIPSKVIQKCKEIISFAKQYGGTVCVLWHNNSFVSPRLWGDVYKQIIQIAKKDNAWLATAGSIVAWYKKRRSINIKEVIIDNNIIKISIKNFPEPDHLPDLKLRIHIHPDKILIPDIPHIKAANHLDIKLEKPEIVLKLKESRS